jgi:hypothetical protein
MYHLQKQGMSCARQKQGINPVDCNLFVRSKKLKKLLYLGLKFLMLEVNAEFMLIYEANGHTFKS